MRIIQTFYTKNIKSANPCGGWLTEEYHYMCWALSCLSAKRCYGKVELYTDIYGAEMLIDRLKLPYDDVHIILDDVPILNSLPSFLWAMSKIYTYSIQTEPFMHIDGDFVFWKTYDLNRPLIFQNIEYDVPLYGRIYQNLKKNSEEMVFERCLVDPFIEGAFNMGIFGGTNLPFISEYANNALKYATKKSSNNKVFEDNKNDINCFIEQYYAYFLTKKMNIDYNVIHRPVRFKNETIGEGTDFNLWDKNIGFSHFLGQSKLNYHVADFVARELYNNYPSYYRLVHNLFKDGHKKEFFFSKENKELNIEYLYTDLMSRLQNSHYILEGKLKKNYMQYLQDSKNLFLETVDSFGSPIASEKNPLPMKDWKLSTKFRLNGNFICINRYMCPWSEMYKAQRFAYKEFIVKEEDITYEKYCMFILTPFHRSMASIWVNEITAYLIKKVLSTNDTSMEEIWNKMNLLVKGNQKISLNIISLLLKTISENNIIDISNE